LFPRNVRVKKNRKILLYKRGGGDSGISEIKNKTPRGGIGGMKRDRVSADVTVGVIRR
jgi:hypothetical protein